MRNNDVIREGDIAALLVNQQIYEPMCSFYWCEPGDDPDLNWLDSNRYHDVFERCAVHKEA
ncbi:hypothetical protein ACLQ3C_08825 [Gordonia sp. DT30]|uniref:hypothetical protein n=1 Tax=unclassified Gordonia (in: high G+C Gram-positive bacteria) TaxID=2657482 RepID=UPI003CF9C7C8